MNNFERKIKAKMEKGKVTVRQKHLELIKELSRNEMHKRSCRDRIGFLKFLSRQIGFIGWKIWLVQGSLFAIIISFFTALSAERYLSNPRYVAGLLCCLSVLVLMSTIPFVYRGIHYKMQEVEAASYFSCVKLLMAKAILIGIGDLCLLSGILCITVWNTYLPLGSTILYLLFPFLLGSCGLLYLMTHVAGEYYVLANIGLCVLLLIVFVLLTRFSPSFYQQTFSIRWVAVCIGLVMLCVMQLRQILYRFSYAEMQLIS